MNSAFASRARMWLARRSLLRLGATAALGGGLPSVAPAAEVDPHLGLNGEWVKRFASAGVFGYCDRHSVTQGEHFDVMLSLAFTGQSSRARVQFYRLGHYPWGRTLVWESKAITIARLPVQCTAATAGAAWTPVLSIDTSSWLPGCYSADVLVEGAAQPEYHVLQVIVRPVKPSGDVLVKLSTNTWQAYNVWGGHSLYQQGDDQASRGIMVSFDRPALPTLFEYEFYLVTWLEELAARERFSVDYASNFDVHKEAGLLDAYRLAICGSHDEYWSKEEFDAFERRIRVLGGNTIFFGANTGYWQVRYSDIDAGPGLTPRGRQLVCHKSLDDPIMRRAGTADPLLLVTARYRDKARRPETMLLGAAYENWFQPRRDGGPRYAYHVTRTDLPFFANTGLKVGDVLADVVGYEWDNRDPGHDGRRLFSPGVSQIRELPADRIKVLFTGNPVAADGTPSLAEATYFDIPGGAKAFNAGSIRWAWGLGRPGFEVAAFKTFNANLVLDFLGREAG